MQTIIALLFCLMLGVMVKAQGWLALLWVPLGFAVGLFVTAQIALPIILGLPRAIRFVSRGEMRAGVYRRLLFTPVLWIVQLFVLLFLVGFFWPSAAVWLQGNVGLWLGLIGILLSPLSKKSRADFRADFDRSYGQFYTSQLPPKA